MQIVAKTNDGVLISATTTEVIEILRSVTGKSVEKLEIGQKIPAIDYASSISKVKNLGSEYAFTRVRDSIKALNEHFSEVVQSVEKAASIEL